MRIHLIAIGGAVMHNLALELQYRGHDVTGSDDTIFSPAKERLAEAGLLPSKEGWFEENINPDVELVILGMHAKKGNPELEKALGLGIKILSFPAFIAEHASNKIRLVVAGSHGKTTTTAMVMHCLRKMNLDFDYLVGSKLENFERMVSLSDAPIMVIEGDEYLSSALDLRPKFLHYTPHAAVITGIAWDHINVFPTYASYVEQFNLFTQSLQHPKDLFVHQTVADEEQFKSSIPTVIYDAFDFTETEEATEVYFDEKMYKVQVFGAFNIQNMKAASLLCEKVGIATKDFLESMTDFYGTGKRQEKIFETEQTLVMRDFAHSPSKVKAAVDAVRNKYPNRYLVCMLELHTYSSLNEEFIPHYQNVLHAADASLVFADSHALKIKEKQFPSESLLKNTFPNAKIAKNMADLLDFENNHKFHKPTVWLLMSSGNFAGWNPKF
jgi:UDP-N-acetylmuramate: L-alanyl-gamma-D-glutamyl-meso-diaminopimelate ligase